MPIHQRVGSMTPRWILAAAIAMAQGCMSLPSPITVSNPDRAGDVDFRGLRAQLDSAGALRILVVHGMSPHSEGYSDGLQRNLASALGLTRDADCQRIDTYTSSYGSRSYVQRCAYKQGEHSVRVYELTWSELSQQFATDRLGYDSAEHSGERVFVNRKLKERLINRAFSDAITYTGSFAPTMQTAVARAICAVMTDERAGRDSIDAGCTFATRAREARIAAGRAPAVVLISHSLGSYMVFETIEKLVHEPKGTGRQISAADFLQQLRLVGMLANQLPLLALSRIPAEKQEQPVRSLEFLRGMSAQFPIVAVSDPNDLLTFPLAPGWPKILGNADTRVINVKMANANDVFALAVANPGKAHTGYFDNPCVTRLLVDASTNCSVVRIAGVHYANLGRMQANVGALFRARSPISIPAYASIGVSSFGVGTGIAARSGTLVVQGRTSVVRTWNKPVRASPQETFAGVGVRLSALTLTVGVDELWNTRTHSATPRWTVGTGW